MPRNFAFLFLVYCETLLVAHPRLAFAVRSAGIDVSDYQGDITPSEWTQIHNDGKDFAWTKAWGDYVTYGALAAMAGYPGAARAAGTACRMNPFVIAVPAHRVIAAGNRLGGFLGRPDIKRRLLEREGSGPFKP